MAGIRKTWRIAEFRALLVSYVINRAGDVVGALALAVIVLGVTRSAIATAALFLATQFVPGLVGPFLVARIGAIPAGRILPVCYLVEACLFLVLAAVARHTTVGLIIALAFADGTLAFAARSVTRATTASTLIPHDLMPEGKAAFNLALAAATVAGPVLGGAVLALLGPTTALAADGVSFLVAALLIICTPGLRAPAAKSADPVGTTRRRHLRATFGYVAGNAPLRVLVFGEGIAFIFFYLVVPVTVIYATRSLHAGPAGYAAILASWGAGAVIGSTVHVRLARRVGHAGILISTAAVAVGIPGDGAGAHAAHGLWLQRARRSGQRDPVGFGRDCRTPTRRGAFPPPGLGDARVDGCPGTGGRDRPRRRADRAVLAARRISRRRGRARRADRGGRAQPHPWHGYAARASAGSRQRLASGPTRSGGRFR